MAKAQLKKIKPARGGPMQFTASSSYAIHGLAYLVMKEPEEVTFLSEISEYFGIPSSYMAKVFQALAREGLVQSFRGAKGGYALARPPVEITLRHVIEIFEGPVTQDCTLSRGPCNFEPLCHVYGRLAEAQQAYLKALDEHTILSIGEEFRRFEEMGLDSRTRLPGAKEPLPKE
jgi:Rrf2 family transcriptional regulator, iron-sulfur cluster assembly transcription factor